MVLGDITGLDFESGGNRIASIDENGVLVLSETHTSNYLFHVDLQGESCKIMTTLMIYSLFSQMDIINVVGIQRVRALQ